MKVFGFIDQAYLIFWSSTHQQTCLHHRDQTPSNYLTLKTGPSSRISVRGEECRIVLHKEVAVCDSTKCWKRVQRLTPSSGRKLKMLEGQEGQSKQTSSTASKSPEPTPRSERSTDWPESLQDIKSLLSQIDQTKTRLQEYLSTISTATQEAATPVVNPLDSWSLQNWNENDFNALFQSDKIRSSPDFLSLDTTNLLGSDYFGDIHATAGVAVAVAPMVMPQLTPPASVSSRSCKTFFPRFH
jgi:hypothetical protein